MARMMKDSGVEWIGLIPEEWQICKLKNICDIFGRIGFRGYTQDDLVDEGEGAITLSPSNFSNMKMNYNKCTYISWEKYFESPEIQIENGHILFVKTGSTYGKSCLVTDLPMEATINPQMIVIKNTKINNKYLAYFLQSKIIENQTETSVVGGTIPTIAQEKIKNFVIILPNEKEQYEIVSFLDEKVGWIDTILSKTKETIEEYRKYKNAVVAEVITKGLDKTVTMKECGIEWIGKIPSHWKVHTLSQVFKQLKNKNSDLAETNLLSLSYGKIKRKDINSSDGLLPESFDGYNVIDKNDIVLRLTDLQNDHKSLRVGHVKERGIITSAYVTLRCKENIETDYYYYFLHTFDIFKGFYGMGAGVRQGLNYEGIRSMKILSPDIEEQQEIVDYLNAKCAEIDSLIAKKEAFVEEMEAYKKSLIYEYVTGKKEVK